MKLGWGGVAALVVALGLALAAPALGATVTSTFSVDDEGWTVIGDTQSGSVIPTYVPSGGNPGGHVSTDDAGAGGVMYWNAPPKFLGNRLESYGRNLRFDLAQNLVDSQFDDDDVILEGNGLTLIFNTPANPAATWTPYVVSLNESAGWVLQDSVPLRAPTRAEFNQVLSALATLRIRAEYRIGSDVDQLDSAILEGGPDADGDGVPDATDACPAVRALTANGCPPAAPPAATPAVAPGPPVLGRAVNVEPVAGDVFVSLPGGTAQASASVPGIKGRNFVPLREARQVPVGSILDTRRGTVRLTTASSTPGRTQSADFLSGVFQVLQSRQRSARGLSELRLKGSSFRSCGRSRRAAAATGAQTSARRSRRTIRRLRGNGSGRFRTRGRYSSATVRGTDWTVSDRCDGTLTKVKRGAVTVRDFRRRKAIRVRAGRSYLARAAR